MTAATPMPARSSGAYLRPDVATQWQLMWRRFRRHHMAMVGLVILGLLFLIAIFAEVIAPYQPAQRNTRYLASAPMAIQVVDDQGNFHRPFVYARINKRDPSTLRMTSVEDRTQIWPIALFFRGEPYHLWGFIPANIHLFGVEGGFVHLFGTDTLGRDLFSRAMYATRISLSIGLVGVLVSFVVGTIIGGIAGFFGGTVDFVIMRIIEFKRSIPTLPLWLALSAALPRDWSSLQIYIAITFLLALISWTHLARTVRSKLLALREEEFVIAARLAGCSDARLIWRHLLPSFMSFLIVDVTIAFPEVLLAETSLSFLGLGLREPVESWGVLLYAAQNIRSIAHLPWLLIPGAFVIFAALAFNFLGDGLRDAADPYTK